MDYKERINQDLQDRLLSGEHSLKNNPSFPSGDDFIKSIIGDRFDDVVLNVKRHFECENIDNDYIMSNMMTLVKECMQIESKHKGELERLAIELVRNEYDIPEDVEIEGELTEDIKPNEASKKGEPFTIDVDFNSHQEMEDANSEVHKRRLLNALIQGSAKKSSNLLHKNDQEITSINPLLLNKYHKLMSISHYLFYIIDQMDDGVTGGIVNVEYPKAKGEKVKISAKGMVFPVLIHELVRGVMELLSYKGLPKDRKIRKYVTSKADYLNAEADDMRMGPKLYERFLKHIPEEDQKLKHHIYSELASLPANQFHETMREVFAGTKMGKEKITNLVEEIKKDIKRGEFEEQLNEKRNKHKESKYISKPEELDLLLDEMKDM